MNVKKTLTTVVTIVFVIILKNLLPMMLDSHVNVHQDTWMKRHHVKLVIHHASTTVSTSTSVVTKTLLQLTLAVQIQNVEILKIHLLLMFHSDMHVTATMVMKLLPSMKTTNTSAPISMNVLPQTLKKCITVIHVMQTQNQLQNAKTLKVITHVNVSLVSSMQIEMPTIAPQKLDILVKMKMNVKVVPSTPVSMVHLPLTLPIPQYLALITISLSPTIDSHVLVILDMSSLIH